MTRLVFCLMFALFVTTSIAWSADRSGVVTMEFDLSSHPKEKPVRLWIPYPVSDADQDVTNVKVVGDYSASAVYADGVEGTPILYAEWPSGAVSRKLTLSFSALRREVRFDLLEPFEIPWNPADYSRYLHATSLGPIDGAVGNLAREIVKGKGTVLEKARAIYDWTVEKMYRDPETRGCGKGDVCALLDKPGGKCTDISSVFVALCRAAGVPTREIFGIRLAKEAGTEISKWQHCWAEFFLPGTGWVPADPADVRKAMLRENLDLKSPRTAERREYFWGGIDPERIRLATGRDIVLNPPQSGAPLNTFGYPYAEVDGKPLDFYDPAAFSYRFVYTER